jgi:hypothetical protein
MKKILLVIIILTALTACTHHVHIAPDYTQLLDKVDKLIDISTHSPEHGYGIDRTYPMLYLIKSKYKDYIVHALCILVPVVCISKLIALIAKKPYDTVYDAITKYLYV